jgi:hypothetical protein
VVGRSRVQPSAAMQVDKVSDQKEVLESSVNKVKIIKQPENYIAVKQETGNPNITVIWFHPLYKMARNETNNTSKGS